MLPTWPQALNAEGAIQMGVLRRVFEARDEWWNLVPDSAVLAEGGMTTGTILNLAARHSEGRWLMAYLGEASTVSVDLSKGTGERCRTFWIDPRTGNSRAIADFSTGGVQTLTTPEGWEDALLIVMVNE